MSSANLDDAQTIRDFRARLAAGLQKAGVAMDGVDCDLQRVLQWLGGEQLSHWVREARVRDEQYETARGIWLETTADVRMARHGRGGGKQSSDEERMVMERARRRRDEATEHLALIRKWHARLEEEVRPLTHHCHEFASTLRGQGQRSLLQLDRLSGHIDAYLEVPLGAVAGVPAPPAPDHAPQPAAGGSTP